MYTYIYIDVTSVLVESCGVVVSAIIILRTKYYRITRNTGVEPYYSMALRIVVLIALPKTTDERSRAMM